MSDKEPPLRGSLQGCMNKDWLEWYRNQGQGHSLREARDEALRRIALLQPKEIPPKSNSEPPLKNANGLRNPEWVRWYRSSKGCLLREAMDELDRRISKQSR